MKPAISIVIPCYNEAAAIERTLLHAVEGASLSLLPRIYVIDASQGNDGTENVVASISNKCPNFISYIHLDRPSRGAQLICGAKLATTPYLLFLHADTLLPRGWDAAIVNFFNSNKDVSPLLGCFQLALPPPLTLSLQIMVWTANMRAKLLHLPYGDQAYFVRRDEYENIGGFANIPLMEDVDLLHRYKKAFLKQKRLSHAHQQDDFLSSHSLQSLLEWLRISSCIKGLPMSVVTSPRRWNRKGVWWNTLCNQFYMLAWGIGVSPETIYGWYYGTSFKK